MSILSKLGSTTKSILFVVYLLACITLAIGGPGWSDYAKTPFWWTFWDIACGVGIVGFIGGIFWYFNTKQQN
jgi:drug/metabolite transporter (DMT)-like permease